MFSNSVRLGQVSKLAQCLLCYVIIRCFETVGYNVSKNVGCASLVGCYKNFD
jgi:hypothetical protein